MIRACGAVLAVEALQHRDAEGQRLSGAGLGLPDHVLAVEGQGKSELLDAEGMGNPLLRKGRDSLGSDAQVFEAWIVQCDLQV